jgi:hypothetical protein
MVIAEELINVIRQDIYGSIAHRVEIQPAPAASRRQLR